MSDDAWRAAVRAHEAAPHDMELLRRAITAGRRARLNVAWLLDREVAPGATFRSDEAYRVRALLPAENVLGSRPWSPSVDRSYQSFSFEVREVGRTPGVVEVPAHHRWWVAPEGHIGRRLPWILDEVEAQGVAGLDLSGSQVTNEALAPVEGLSALSTVILQGCKKLVDGLEARLPASLRFLSVRRATRLGDGFLRALGRLPDLSVLDLGATRVTAEGLKALPVAAPGLTHLDLCGIKKLRNEALEGIGRLGELRELNLGVGSWSRAGLVHLASLERLEHLDLQQCSRLTDEALASLLGLRSLVSLDLSFCAGLTVDGLSTLAALPSLRRLRVAYLHFGDPTGRGQTSWNALIAAEQARLRAALPRVTIQF